MKTLNWMSGILAAALAGTVTAGDAPWDTPSWSTSVCSVELPGDRLAGRDNDTDGVPDSDDWCTRTAAGTRVGADGCAPGEIAVSCDRPAPAPKTQVVPAVKGKDSDGDGVDDADDRCPGTTRGVAVDRKGCAKIEKIVLKGVGFGTGSAILKPAAYDTLRTVVAAMKANTKLEVEVGGYTDSVGDDAKNKALSERRAKSVKDFLVKEGVDAGRLSIKGYGEADPADTNDTPAGRANNRRVEFKVTDS